ncbi:MAG: branched chain amino acid aminotransferase [Betaproteobacteria bacterium TMED82]|nr:MAG: branched chain amino acid aminotransferase [Betaproteobacteria bacterium TMED82]|tara:strand:+ start:65641 stop:66570 length:930 start_codon:yes stop_codon:yes gene_type:complete
MSGVAMSKLEGLIWMNNELVDWKDAKIHVLTHTLHYGMGVFEGIRCYKIAEGGAVFRLTDHIRRLFDSAKIFEMVIPYSQEKIEHEICNLIKKNFLTACYIRPIVFYGSESMGLSTDGCSVNVSIAAWPWGTYLGDEGLEKGIRVKTSSFTRHHVNSSLVRAKACGYYINSILAHQEVARHGYDEALLLDTDGYVSEGAGENIFIVKKGVLYTTDLSTCLDGITRDTVFHISKELNLSLVEKRLTRDDLYCADEAFFTGTAAEITPISEIDDRVIGFGSKGKITHSLQNLFFEIVNGKNNNYKNWLTYI